MPKEQGVLPDGTPYITLEGLNKLFLKEGIDSGPKVVQSSPPPEGRRPADKYIPGQPARSWDSITGHNEKQPRPDLHASHRPKVDEVDDDKIDSMVAAGMARDIAAAPESGEDDVRRMIRNMSSRDIVKMIGLASKELVIRNDHASIIAVEVEPGYASARVGTDAAGKVTLAMMAQDAQKAAAVLSDHLREVHGV